MIFLSKHKFTIRYHRGSNRHDIVWNERVISECERIKLMYGGLFKRPDGRTIEVLAGTYHPHDLMKKVLRS